MPTWKLRMAVAKQLINWGVIDMPVEATVGYGDEDDSIYSHLAWLLGYASGLDFMLAFRADDREKLELLLGPHGLTIYKILLLRKTSDV